MTNLSPLQIERLKYQPKLPSSLANGINHLVSKEGSATESVANQEEIKALFRNTYGKPTVTFETSSETASSGIRNVGVILSGGQAPGGHNVIAGLYDALKQANSANKLYGFLGGPSGIIEGKYVEFTDSFIDEYRNTGGFDIIGSGRTKLGSVSKVAIISLKLEIIEPISGINSIKPSGITAIPKFLPAFARLTIISTI